VLAAFTASWLDMLADWQCYLSSYDGWLAMLLGFEALLVVSFCWLTE
jgi:hypothetical protein